MPDIVSGILRRTGRGGGGALHDTARVQDVALVSAQLIREHGLVPGASVTGVIRGARQSPELISVTSVCGLTPEAFKARTPFDQLVAIDPCERFELAAAGEIAMRVVDLVAPIGKGTRGLIVSPPKAGKTTLLEQIAHGIRATDPQARIIVLLIDERPEEVTYFRRTVSAEVFASSSDRSVPEHVALCELMLAHMRAELECGHNLVVLVDSLTRLVRAFNRQGTGVGRTLSGGLEAGTLDIPRRFFGMARNIEGGGSVTILATVLVDTNSRMDQLIYEEFKGTGNSELVLDRALAEARIFPAINLQASSTRKEHYLYSPEDGQRLTRLRRYLAGRDPREALEWLLRVLGQYPTNEAVLQKISAGG